nr:hypothetical protein [Tanacetum cinerariifolium]
MFSFDLKGYSYSDYTGANMDRKSTSGKKPGAKSRLRRKHYSKHIFESQTKASKSKTGQPETKSSLAKNKILSHPLPHTLVVGEMHKEAQQATGGPTSLGATGEEGAHPQLNSDKTKSAGDGLRIAYTDSGTNEESRADNISKKIKLEDLEFLKDTRSSFFTLDFSQDKPIIITNESEKKDADKEETYDTSHDMPKTLQSHLLHL